MFRWFKFNLFCRAADCPAWRPLPDDDSVFEFIRECVKGWVSDPSAIKLSDPLVSRDHFGADGISHFVADLERWLDLDIPNAEWRTVVTFEDMTRLLAKYLARR